MRRLSLMQRFEKLRSTTPSGEVACLLIDEWEPHDIAFGRSASELNDSVARIGVLTPIWVHRGQHRFALIHGFRRLQAAKRNGYLSIPARYVSIALGPGERSMLGGIIHHIELGFETYERARFLAKLVDQFRIRGDRLLETEYLPHIGEANAHERLRQNLMVGRMGDQELVWCRERSLPLKLSCAFAEIDEEDRFAFRAVCEILDLGTNRIRGAWNLVEQISIREGTAVREVVKSPEVMAVLRDQETSASRKTELFLETLYRRRYPDFSQRKRALKEEIAAMDLPGPVRLKVDEALESNQVTLEMRLRDAEQWANWMSRLAGLAGEGHVERLFKLLRNGRDQT